MLELLDRIAGLCRLALKTLAIFLVISWPVALALAQLLPYINSPFLYLVALGAYVLVLMWAVNKAMAMWHGEDDDAPAA